MATRKRKTFDPSLKLEVVRMIKEQKQSIQNESLQRLFPRHTEIDCMKRPQAHRAPLAGEREAKDPALRP
jgi:hypothetical protein